MGTFDFSLSELKEYNGINPKPADFDEFWDRSIAEMLKIDPKVEMKPAGIKSNFAECYSLFFDSMQGSRIHAKLVIPKDVKEKIPAVLKFHGYSWNSGDWSDGFMYAAAGYAYAALDCRGQRGFSEDMNVVRGENFHGHFVRGVLDCPEKMTMRNTFLDTAKLAQVIMNMDFIDKDRIGAFGGSQGGALTVACAALVPEIKKAAVHFPFLSDYKRVWEMDLAEDAYVEMKQYFRSYDPRHEREDEFFERLGYIDIQHLAPRIKADVLFFTGLMDKICPPSTQFAAYNKIKSKKDMIIYPDYGHEYAPGMVDETFGFLMEV